MFTGLIQCTGKILRVGKSGGEARLSIAPARPFADLAPGESIAVNGACLTVEKFDSASFSAFASGETLRLTNLGGLRRGDPVNLERALRLGDSLGGHLVSGHVDALCTLTERRPAGSSILLRFSFPKEFKRQILPKGSVAVDGVSLTVNACGDDFFEVNVIPATLAETTLAGWQAGRAINLETDLIGKYVERMLGVFGTDFRRAAVDEALNTDNKNQAGLSLDFFRENGF
ncbi:MAG: riboflavin synthase [Deltaproteobacteria bacterium]|jgi:riboflavin synthase|nr:riboflavin synthase [Deltaproteobacteria bacterium]